MERHYETIWIVKSDLGAPGIKEILENATTALEGGNGHVNKVDEWGMKRLAYPIQKKNEGYYTLIDFNAVPETVTKMENVFRYNEDVVRYQTVRLDEEYVEPVVEPEPEVEPTAEPATEAEPVAEPVTEPTAEPAAEAVTEPAVETTAEVEIAEKAEAPVETAEAEAKAEAKAEKTEEGSN